MYRPAPLLAFPALFLALALFCSLLAPSALAQDASTEDPVQGEAWPHPLPYAPSLDKMIGQMLMAGFRGTTVEDDSPIARDLELYHLGGVVLFNHDVVLGHGPRNIESPHQLRLLTRSLQERSKAATPRLPLFIAVDQEGGRVQRLRAKAGFEETPSPQTLAETAPGEAVDPLPTMAAALMIGQQLARNGINLNFAPVLDLNVNPDNPIIGGLGRSFGSDAATVSRLAGVFLDNMRSQGVLACVKHFPGHGSSRADSHLGLPDVSATWNEAELRPFADVIAEEKADMVMTAHLFNNHWDQDHPATLSRAVITGMLRERLGFEGVVVSDDMNMGAITENYGLEEAIFLAIDAGCDILLFGNNLSYDPNVVPGAHGLIRKLVASGRISVERIRESYERIAAIKQRIHTP